MKIFEKIREGRYRAILFCGIRLFLYECKGARQIRVDSGNVLHNVPAGCGVVIYGANNRVTFHKPVDGLFSGTIYIGSPDCPANGCLVDIGPGCTSNGVEIRLMENNSTCVVGEDCMISDDVRIWVSDTHALTGTDGGVINLGRFVRIGRHVWIGTGVSVLKNTVIPDGAVVGACAVVSGTRFQPEGRGCVLAGNPARVVKQDVSWHRERPGQMA